MAVKLTKIDIGYYLASFDGRAFVIRRANENEHGQRWEVATITGQHISQHFTLKDARESIA